MIDRKREPALVAKARELLASGATDDDVAASLPGERSDFAAAARYWEQRMHNLPSDDFGAAAILRVLNAAIARTPWAHPNPRPGYDRVMVIERREHAYVRPDEVGRNGTASISRVEAE